MSSPPKPRWRTILRAAAMVVGAGAIAWQTRAPWSWGLLLAVVVLLFAAAFAPRMYRPMEAALDWLQGATLRSITWALLALVFAAIFIPASLWLRLTKSSRLGRNRKADTYWRDCRPRDAANFFGRQF